MQSSQTPTLIPLPFASGGGKNTIPEASQLPGNPGGASFTDGFPPATRTPLVAGGIPPAGLDMNGILYMITQSTRWSHAGGLYGFSSSFAADVNVGGYPSGAELMSADLQGSWVSLNDNNTDNPDTGPGTKWVPGRTYGITALGGLTNANVTLTPAQAAKNKITLAGTLTGNIQIIFPTWLRNWEVVNNTTGSFTVTCKTASGTGVTVAQGGVLSRIACDGTNIVQLNEQMNVAAATTSTNPVQLGQVQTQAGTAFTTAGTAPSYTLTPSPAITAYATNQRFSVTFNAAGTTGSNTMNISGLGVKNLKQYDANGVKQPAVIPASGWSSDVVYDGTDLVVLDPVAPKVSIAGSMRNAKITVSAATQTLTFTADEVVVETGLGGMAYTLSNVNVSVNTAGVGIGGMDTGSPPANGYGALYLAYNPATNAVGLFCQNATSSAVGNVYGGGNRPSGYTATGLVSVWPTNGSGQFKIGSQRDRWVSFPTILYLSSSTAQASPASISLASAVPPNATSVRGSTNITSSATGLLTLNLSADASNTGLQAFSYGISSASLGYANNYAIDLITAQTLYWVSTVASGTPTYQIYACAYQF
ncbi:hypothetical protein [Ralstonia pickettii]|uniref:hypothetical protein n=1 Tax=Ralstonia pickettii TaxID=329 RepID=UPI0015F85302|nr:hypothetical protein [Ralstonia pickettii]MBB0026837.1 hypothetical protein [Ralstonia pickettii]MBB0034665.1 hypothetical protein [Ralstonia pickettii]MBB0100000.1 hypothetical protein [Ralstonia pickettii]MBB0109959.1 hypothetical protein [Ralstonia pickettii]MBB0130939.1 hypothetical protein [Ralstonia pickettii]